MSKVHLALALLLHLIGIESSAKHPAADTACHELYIEFNYYFKMNQYSKGVPYWRQLIVECPTLYQTTYLRGEKIYKSLLKTESSQSRREQQIDTLLLIQDLRMKYYGQEGMLMGKKGVILRKYRPELRREAFELFRRSVALEKEKSKVRVLNDYFAISVELSQREQLDERKVLGIYELITDIIDLRVGKGLTEKQDKLYQSLTQNINLKAKALLNAEHVVPWKELLYPVYRDSMEWLNRSLQTLDNAGCQQTEIRMNIAYRILELNPSSNWAYNMSIKAIKLKDYERAVKLLAAAIRLAETDSAKAEYLFKQAEVNHLLKQYEEARKNLQMILKLKADKARAYEMMGVIYSDFANLSDLEEFDKASIYWLAVDNYKTALKRNPSNPADLKRRIFNLEANFPSIRDIHWRSLKVGEPYTVGFWIQKVTNIRQRIVDTNH